MNLLHSSEAVKGLASGLRAIQAPDFLLSRKYQEQQWRADRTAATPTILEFEKLFQNRMRKLGIPMFAHCIVRSMAQQTAVYVAGHSKAKAGQSAHNYGLAVDMIHSIHAWDLSEESWLDIGHIGKEIAAQNGLKLVWGGDWKKPGQRLGWDPAHWELANWKSLVDAMHRRDIP